MAQVQETRGPLPLMRKHSYVGYQFYARAEIPGCTAKETQRFIALVVLLWISTKMGKDSPIEPQAYLQCGDEIFEGAMWESDPDNDLQAVFLPGEKAEWAFCLKEPESDKHTGRPPVLGRIYQTDVAARVLDATHVEIACRVRLIDPVGAREDYAFRPAIIKRFVEASERYGVSLCLTDRYGVVNKDPTVVSSKKILNDVLTARREAQDPMPYLIVVQEKPDDIPDALRHENVIGADLFSRSVLSAPLQVPETAPRFSQAKEHAENLAKHNYGYCRVFFLQAALIPDMQKKTGHEILPNGWIMLLPDGQIKTGTYWPDPEDEEGFFKKFIKQRFSVFDESGRFAGELEDDKIKREWKDDKQNYAVLQQRYLALQKRQEELLTENKRLQQEVADEYARACEDKNAEYKDELATRQADAEHLLRENDQLRATIQSQTQKIDAWYSQVQQSAKLQAAVEYRFAFKQYPKTVYDVAAYFENMFADRIVFTEKAKTSLKTCGIPLDKLWEALYLLATYGYDFKREHGSGNICDRLQEKTSFEVAQGIGKTTNKNGDLAKQYMDEYNGEAIDIRPHIKIDIGNQNYRIYFGFSKDDVPVVGHCGEHLESAATRYHT